MLTIETQFLLRAELLASPTAVMKFVLNKKPVHDRTVFSRTPLWGDFRANLVVAQSATAVIKTPDQFAVLIGSLVCLPAC